VGAFVVLAVLAALAAVAACAGSPKPPPAHAARPAVSARPVARLSASDAGADEHGPARSHLLGTIARKALGPFTAGDDKGGIATWIATAEHGTGAELVAVPLGADGAPLHDPQVVASVPREATSLVVRPTERTRRGWLVAWSAILDRGESLTLLELAPDGSPRGAAIDLQRTSDHIAWADIVPTAGGAMCVWAEETAGGDANILTAAIDSDGKPHATPVRVARGVERWATVRTDTGVALALVTPNKGSDAGRLAWLVLDADGGARGTPIPIGTGATVSGDVDVLALRDGWLLAWTDLTGEDAQVMLATVDAAGHVQGPVSALNEVGGSSLVAIAAGTGGVALAWRSPHVRARPTYMLHLATVSTAGALSARPVTSLSVAAAASTELVAAADGFALITTPVPPCPSAGDAADDCSAVPTFVRYDAALSPLQTEPLLVSASVGDRNARARSAVAWNLRCDADRCLTLAAPGEAPTPVFAIDLARRATVFPTPRTPRTPGALAEVPRATSVVTLASGQPFTDVAAARIGAVTLVATVTNAVDDPAAPPGSRVATIVVRAYDDTGRAVEGPHTLTSRALPVGRVALAAAPSTAATRSNGGARAESGDEVAAAWVVRDDGDPQVHVAAVDPRGHRIKEIQLTTAKGDASEVALAWVGDGWLVAWVDGRDGNGEVYAAKVDRSLNRVSPDQRITRAAGDAADLALAASGGAVWLAWSDPRESPAEGVGDIYVTTLRARDARRAGDEVRVLATAAHSRSPQLATLGPRAVVAWIEEPPTGLDATGAALFAHLDEEGHVLDTGTLRLTDGGRPTALALAPSDPDVHVVIAQSAHGAVTLDAATLSPGGASPSAVPLVDLDAPAPFEVALTLAGGALFYDDIGSTGTDHRVRRMAIAW
jgi:hypothetical protein